MADVIAIVTTERKKKTNLDVAVKITVAGCFLKPSKVSVIHSFLLLLISPLVSGELGLVINPVF